MLMYHSNPKILKISDYFGNMHGKTKQNKNMHEKTTKQSSHKQRQKSISYIERIIVTYDTEKGLILLTYKELLKIKERESKNTEDNDENIRKYNSMNDIKVVT